MILSALSLVGALATSKGVTTQTVGKEIVHKSKSISTPQSLSSTNYDLQLHPIWLNDNPLRILI